MSTSRLLKILLIGAVFAGIVQKKPVFAASLTTIDAGDVQHFEQTYENWVQSLTQSIVPTNPTTVLVDINYSNNPEDLQNYEELKAANHLPGLPDVIDPHFTYPSESPLSALVAKQRIKIIFESELTQNQKKVLEEVLNTKLKLNRDRGDSIVLEHVNTIAAPVAVNHSIGLNLSAIKLSKKQNLALIVLALVGLLGFAIYRNRGLKKNRDTEIEYIRVVPTEKTVNRRLMRRNPRLFARTSMIVNPLNIVLKANPKVLVSVVRNEKIETLARATLHAPEMFTSILLNICTQDQKNQIRGIWNIEQNRVTSEQSQFAQILLAARIFHQLKKQKDMAIDPIIGKYANANHARAALYKRMNLEMNAIKKSINAQNNSQSTAQSEANL